MRLLDALFKCVSFRLELFVHVSERLHLDLMLLAVFVDLVHQYLYLKLLLLKCLLEARYEILLGL